MLKYNLTAAFRSIKRNPGFSLINISGLSLGLTLVIILLTWLQFEFSFDKFHDNADRIYRVVTEFQHGTSSDNFCGTPAPLGEVLKKNIPEIADYVRFGSLGRIIVKFEKEQFWEEIDLADPSIFRIFSFKLLSGDPETALKEPGSIIISETKARKYFGNRNPLGHILLLDNEKAPYRITGVMKDIPANSQLKFDFLGSFSEIHGNLSWNHWNYWTYILTHNQGTFKAISERLPDIVKEIPGDEKFQLHIQPLTSIHLHSGLRYDLPTNTDINTILIISSILLLVLLVACINYMNLATARYTRRGKEAGLRKVASSTSVGIVLMLNLEFIRWILVSLILACPLIVFFMHKWLESFAYRINLSWWIFALAALICIVISLLTVSWHTWNISTKNPVDCLKHD